jgi:hypothetical protein
MVLVCAHIYIPVPVSGQLPLMHIRTLTNVCRALRVFLLQFLSNFHSNKQSIDLSLPIQAMVVVKLLPDKQVFNIFSSKYVLGEFLHVSAHPNTCACMYVCMYSNSSY